MMQRAAAAAALWVVASCGWASTEDPVRSVARPYFQKQPVAAAAPAAQQPLRPAKPPGNFSLLVSDVDIPRAFERWGRERGVAVRWLVERDHLIDAAAGRVEPKAEVLREATEQGSVDSELVAAMAQVAWAFRKSKHPFVIREHDNVIVVQPKSGDRE